MNVFAILIAPLALLVPAIAGGGDVPEPPAPATVTETVAGETSPAGDQTVAQVRIERRVTVRISPAGPALRQAMVSQVAPPRLVRLAERKIGKCVPVGSIAAVQPDAEGRLLLFMRDRRLIAASLEKACSARDYYAGFYLERNSDGMLCVDRDKLHSRAGANCALSRIRQLVAKSD